jgi:hypothetical protein
MTNHKFWLEDFCSLYSSMDCFPKKEMSQNQKLNAMTRLILVLSIVLYFIGKTWWLTFLILGLAVIIVIKYARRDIEGYSALAHYTSPDVNQTVVSPLYAEEYQIPPPSYTLIENRQPGPVPDALEQFPAPAYPYGQYLTKTNLMPQDEYQTHHSGGSANLAREFVNSQFLRHRLAYQEDALRVFRKSLARHWRQNSNDTFSPFSSF